MPMRASTICLIAFSAVMGMASVGLTSAHPHGADIEGADIDDLQMEGLQIDDIQIEGLVEIAPPVTPLAHKSEKSDAKLTGAKLPVSDTIDIERDAPSESQLEESINERLRENKRSDRTDRSGRNDRTERSERNDRRERGGRRNRDGHDQDRPHFDGAESDSESDSASNGASDSSSDSSSGAVTKLTLPTLTLDDLSTSFETRMSAHMLRFVESLGAAREKNEERFAYFDDGMNIENLEDMRQAARLAEEILAESGVISNAADFAADIIEDIQVEQVGNSLSVDFEGKRLGKVTRSQSGGTEHFNIEVLGRFITLNRSEIIGPDGEPRTRITVDIDETASRAAGE